LLFVSFFFESNIFCCAIDRRNCVCCFLVYICGHLYNGKRGEFAALARPISPHVCVSAEFAALAALCMCVYVCMHAHSTRNDVCSPVCVWCRACVLITFAAPFWRPSHTLPCHDVQLHSHTYRVKKARFLRTSPPALSAQLPPSFVVYHLLPHCWLRRCSVVIGGYYQSERKQKTSTWPIEASTANNSKSQPADLSIASGDCTCCQVLVSQKKRFMKVNSFISLS